MPDRQDSKKAYIYDPKTGEWVPSSTLSEGAPTASSDNVADVPNSATDGESVSTVNSKTTADKEFIEEELRTLVGDLAVRPTLKIIRLKVNDTIELLGVGKYLSGKYFVSNVSRTVSKDSGYSQSLTVLKNGFGDSLKKSPSPAPVSNNRESKETVEKSVSPINVGDNVKIVGSDAVYTNNVAVPAWVKKKTLTVQQVSKDGTKVLLMPIYSWTYLKYVQKV